MPNELQRDDNEQLWQRFRAQVCRPYEANPQRLAEVTHWFDGLYAHRALVSLSLEHIERKAAIELKAPGRFPFKRPKTEIEYHTVSFDAFCLNKQMYFSTDAAVLALPYVSDQSDPQTLLDRPDKFIGVWLKDFGPPTDKSHEAYAPGHLYLLIPA